MAPLTMCRFRDAKNARLSTQFSVQTGARGNIVHLREQQMSGAKLCHVDEPQMNNCGKSGI
jgi:hypothetical protein